MDLDSPTTQQSVIGNQFSQEVSSPCKENAKSRIQRPGSRLQELEHELSKIHHKPSTTSAQNAVAAQSVGMQNLSQQQHQTILSNVTSTSSLPVATVAPSVVTSLSNSDNSYQQEQQDQSSATTSEVVI